MSQTPITVSYDIKELFTNLENKIDKLESKIDKIDQKVTALEIGQAEIRGDIKALDEKVSGIEKRVGNQEFLNRTTVGGLILVIVGGLAKIIIDWFARQP
ncbi:MAG: hypothetical protein N5P05_002452 [Chroococcopsis gigantea SAG 12.99]|jgi:outer membrane murein-binding lipoprotein Lpp|nr:hypothetical protein [Chroococcopsis gigantea SAG 12.99]